MPRVVIVGGGFAGLSAARGLARERDVEITLLDERNYHLFQPLLYQVAMAVLSPAEIAAPIRSLLSRNPRAAVRRERATAIDLTDRRVLTDKGSHTYDYLTLACGVRHTYFGNEAWEGDARRARTCMLLVANSTPMVATTIMAMVNASPNESTPGVAYHKRNEPTTPRAVKTPIASLPKKTGTCGAAPSSRSRRGGSE